MYSVTIIYGKPTDPDAFDRYYRNVHIPIAKKMKGLVGWTLSWMDRSDNQAHLVAVLTAPSKKAMDEILASEAGKAAQNDLANFVTGGVQFLFGETEPVAL